MVAMLYQNCRVDPQMKESLVVRRLMDGIHHRMDARQHWDAKRHWVLTVQRHAPLMDDCNWVWTPAVATSNVRPPSVPSKAFPRHHRRAPLTAFRRHHHVRRHRRRAHHRRHVRWR